MFRAIAKFIKIVFYALLVLVGVILAIGNRTVIKITLFPFPYEVAMPIFIFAIILFVAGILLGWAIARYEISRIIRYGKSSSRKMYALENEIAALRSEQAVKNTIITA